MARTVPRVHGAWPLSAGIKGVRLPDSIYDPVFPAKANIVLGAVEALLPSFWCVNCGLDWPENYCSACGKTLKEINRGSEVFALGEIPSEPQTGEV